MSVTTRIILKSLTPCSLNESTPNVARKEATENIHYCTTGRAIRGNIQFEAGSIGPSAARDNTEAEN